MDDAKQAALAELTGKMFAGEIAEGAVVVDDPSPEPIPVVQVAAPAMVKTVATPAPVPIALTPEAVELEPVENVPDFKPRLDDDLKALLEEPDFEAEAAAEVQAALDDPDSEYEYTDPTVAAARLADKKRIEFLESQLVAKSKKGWVEEAKRAYPDLARLIPGEIEAITATSRRAFLRAADAANTKYGTVLAPTIARLEAERVAISRGAVETAREEVANAWGRPAADTLPPMAAAKQDALDKARATGKLENQVRVLLEDTPVL